MPIHAIKSLLKKAVSVRIEGETAFFNCNHEGFNGPSLCKFDLEEMRRSPEWADAQLFSWDARSSSWIGIHSETAVTKIGPREYARRANHEMIVLVAVPWKSAQMSDLGIICVVNDPVLLDTNGAPFTVEDSIADARSLYLPSLSGSHSRDADGRVTVRVELSLRGKPVSRSGVEVFFDATSGLLSSRRAVTVGNAALVSFTPDPIASAPVRIKAGFKFWSSAVELTIF